MAIGLIIALVGVGLSAASAAGQKKAANKSAALAKSTADYNAGLDISQANQLEADERANMEAQRADAEVYTSRQKAAYAASGVLNSGSPLAVEATTAGRMQQRIQQEFINAGQREEQFRAAAVQGVAAGAATAQAESIRGDTALLKGGTEILSTVGNAYQSGTFSGTSSGFHF